MGKDHVIKPPKRRCENCRYWSQLELSNEGECLRYPPQFVGIDSDGEAEFEQPYTGICATCGEWAEDNGKYKWR